MTKRAEVQKRVGVQKRAGADELLRHYLDVEREPIGDRPWVLANMVSSIDGSTAIGGRVGALSSPADRQLFLDLRSVADVVLVGAGTVRQERYGPVRLRTELRDRRLAASKPAVPRLAVVSGSLDLSPDLPVFRDADPACPPIVVTSQAAASRRAPDLPAVEIIEAGEEHLDLAAALRAVLRLGAEVVLCEGGPTLLGALFDSGSVDELCLTLAPLVGGDPLPVTVRPDQPEDPDEPSERSPIAGDLAHAIPHGDDVFLRYEFRCAGSR